MKSLPSTTGDIPSEVETRTSSTLSVILILGCPPISLSGEQDATFVARVRKGAQVYYDTLGRRVIVPTGYQGIGYKESEAAAMKTLLLEQNIISDDIMLEEEANSTVQNAIKCRQMVQGLMQSNTLVNIVVVTSSFHMQRSRYIFSRLFHSESFQLHFEESDNNVKDSVLHGLLKVEEAMIDRLKSGKHRIFAEALVDGWDST